MLEIIERILVQYLAGEITRFEAEQKIIVLVQQLLTREAL